MKCIIKAFNQSFTNNVASPRKGWWGYNNNDEMYIMRYWHKMVCFDAKGYFIITQETRTDKAGIESAILLINNYINKQKNGND